MRLRIAVLAAGLVAFASVAVPGIAGAAPQHNRGLTIHAVPHSIIAGEAVLIYGQLNGPDHANRLIRLFHRVNPNPTFTLIGSTRTDAAGQYEFIRAVGVVRSNRSWFVRGPLFTHSRTVHERVQALVSLQASSVTGFTRHAIDFSGHVTPDHVGSVVLLQEQRGAGDDWKTLSSGIVGPGSNYLISYAWRLAGVRNVRVVFTGDRRNTPAASDPVAVAIQQAQVPDFTIATSDPIVANNASATISGVLYQPGTTTPEPSTTVHLFGRVPGGGLYRELQSTTTSAAGGYSFTVQTTTNELYQVRTVTAPVRTSAQLFQGVQDTVNMTASSSTSSVGGQVTFTGDVSPGKAGHVIYLQRLGRDSDWHTVKVGVVQAGSKFSFVWTFGTAGTKQFRARITGDPANVGGISTPTTIDVSQPPLSTLPTS